MKKSPLLFTLSLIFSALLILFHGESVLAKSRLRINLSPRNVTPRTNIIKTRIQGLTKHGKKQIYGRDGGRGVSASALLDAVRNGKVTRHIDKQRRRFTKYTGKNAVVNINRRGRVITAWPKNRNGVRNSK